VSKFIYSIFMTIYIMGMGKTKGHASGKRRGDVSLWTAADHMNRADSKSQKGKGKCREKMERAAALAHGTKDKMESRKINLHITMTKRAVDSLRDRLKQWDSVIEEKKRKEREEAIRKKEEESHESNCDPKKRQRLGPETWKLRGAARPAWEVYDFDVRYVDPYIKEKEEASASFQRRENLLVRFQNKFGESSVPLECREFLGLLMQLGLLYRQANKIKASRSTFLELMDLDSIENPVTLARCYLIRLYIEATRTDSAKRLLQRLPRNDKSVWVQYSRVIVEYRTLKQSNEIELINSVVSAVKTNLYCALYLAFGEIFDDAIEFAEEIVDATDEEPLEEAIEYCNSEQRHHWESEDGLLSWFQSLVLSVLKDKKEERNLSPSDFDWKSRLDSIEKAAKAVRALEIDTSAEDNEKMNEEEVDILMFAGMFRTAMEMVEEKYGFSS
jgi:hypothetical protein